MEIKKIAVVGAGIMGNGIAQVCAQAKYDVTMTDIQQKFVDNGLENINKSLARMVKSGKVNEGEAAEIFKRIKGTISLKDAVKDADVIIEAVYEDLDVKKKVFKEIEEYCQPTAILASNTSGLMITEIASDLKRPENFVGMHWFMPPAMMKCIEMIKGTLTSDETSKAIYDLSIKLGKEPLYANDVPGFFTTRYINSYLLEAVRLFEANVVGIKEMDTMCKTAFGWPMGPIELMDAVGFDTVIHVAAYLYKETGDPKFVAPMTLKKLVKAGYTGKKPGSKGGFYDYYKISRDK